MMHLCMTPFPHLLLMKCWIMWEDKKCTLSQIDSHNTIKLEFIRKIGIRHLLLHNILFFVVIFSLYFTVIFSLCCMLNSKIQFSYFYKCRLFMCVMSLSTTMDICTPSPMIIRPSEQEGCPCKFSAYSYSPGWEILHHSTLLTTEHHHL